MLLQHQSMKIPSLKKMTTRTTIINKRVDHIMLIQKQGVKANLQELRHPKFRDSRHVLDQVLGRSITKIEGEK